MGIGIKIIVGNDAIVQLSSDTELSFKGLAGETNEDPLVNVWILRSPPIEGESGEAPIPNPPASVWHVYSGGTMLAAAFAMQYQKQDMGSIGNVLSEYWLAAGQFGPNQGDTIPAESYCNDPQNTPISNFAATPFVVPAIGATVQITLLASGAAFDAGNYVDRATNTGLFCGGIFWDVVSVDSATQYTLRNRGIYGAVVVVNG